MATGFLDRRVDRETLPLAVGDVAVIVAFVYAGMVNHGTADFPPVVAELGVVALDVAPFLIGWLLVSIPIGAYSPGAGESAKAAIPLAIRSWIGAAVVGLGLRATPLFPGGVALTFAAVMLVGGAVALGVFRWVVFRAGE